MGNKQIKLILGTMTFGESVFAPDVSDLINLFLASGYDELDTAYVYNEGECERLLGDALQKIDRPYKIATKINPRISGKLDSEAAYSQLTESLSRLKKYSVDTVYLHFPDPATPVESVLEAMSELHNAGAFKELGLSNFPAWMVADVCRLCEKNGWVVPTVFEGIYNPLTRGAENELNACLNYFGMRFYAYNPLCGGLLTGRYGSFEDKPDDGRFTHRPNYMGRYWKKSFFEGMKIISETAEKHGISCIEATYRWMAYSSMLDEKRGDGIIIGVSKLGHLQQNINTLKAGPLPQDVLDAFDRAWAVAKADSPDYFTLYKGKTNA